MGLHGIQPHIGYLPCRCDLVQGNPSVWRLPLHLKTYRKFSTVFGGLVGLVSSLGQFQGLVPSSTLMFITPIIEHTLTSECLNNLKKSLWPNSQTPTTDQMKPFDWTSGERKKNFFDHLR
jgi:hypothetical protein